MKIMQLGKGEQCLSLSLSLGGTPAFRTPRFSRGAPLPEPPSFSGGTAPQTPGKAPACII